MMPDKVILKGYYGFGNFGDDILMLSAFGWLRQQYPKAKISICTDSANASYIPSLFTEPVTIIQNHDDVQADWIIHGGGGVYFDFKEGSSKNKLINKLIRAIGEQSFKKVIRLGQKFLGRTRIHAPFRAGFGIGVGTYTSSSARLYADIQELVDFKFMLVRDSESVTNLKKLNINCPAVVSSDLAFMSEHWLSELNSYKTDTKVIGVILRDWVYNNHAYFDVMEQVAERLEAAGFTIKFFSFDSFADQSFIKRFSGKYSVEVWNPFKQTVRSFLEKINECQLMVTSRAHGAIVSACLGIPAVCLEIEPKLVHIVALLRTSSVLVKQPFETEKLVEVIQTQMNNLPQLREATKLDHERNRQEMFEGLSKFQKFGQAS